LTAGCIPFDCGSCSKGVVVAIPKGVAAGGGAHGRPDMRKAEQQHPEEACVESAQATAHGTVQNAAVQPTVVEGGAARAVAVAVVDVEAALNGGIFDSACG
jgi:hypothetical protein